MTQVLCATANQCRLNVSAIFLKTIADDLRLSCESNARSNFSDSQHLTTKQHAICASFVIGLLTNRRPSTITRFVVAVVIDAIDRCSAWSWSHIFQKLGEVGFPCIADRNSSAAPLLKTFTARAQATRTHRAPDDVLRQMCCVVAASAAMFGKELRRQFPVVAPTTERPATAQRRAVNRLHDAAFTATDPLHRPHKRRFSTQHRQSAEDESRHVFQAIKRAHALYFST